ncbi:hypothetical protein GWI33_011075, partial [Rhynchophorus ferrugineus]
ELYKAKASAENGIASVQKNSPDEQRYERLTAKNDQPYFNLKAANHQVIGTSQFYSSEAARDKAKASAENGIASVQKNSPDEQRYERLTAKNDQPYFNLKAANHQVIGTSQFYSSEAARDKGIESVKNNGSSTTIKDLTV